MPDIDYAAIMANVDYKAVSAAGAAGFMFSAAWHIALGRFWTAALDKPPPHTKAAPWTAAWTAPWTRAAAGAGLFANLVIAAVLYGVMLHAGGISPFGGIFSGVLVWLGFFLTHTVFNQALRQSKRLLGLMDGCHWLGVLILQGALLGALG